MSSPSSNTSQCLHVLTNYNQIAIDVTPEGDCVTNKLDDDEVSEGDVKLQKAIEEMKRLDQILSLKTFQSQEAKRLRKDRKDQLWQELMQDTPKGRSQCAHEAFNTRSFLALDANSAKVHQDALDFLPVFETEAPGCEDESYVNSRSNISAEIVESPEAQFEESEQVFFQERSCCDVSKSKKKHKDFVKKNIELISKGQDVLTQPEKERLDELLREIDQVEDCPADAEDDLWAVSVSSGVGYTPEPPDLQHLHDIDSQIRLLLPLEEFASLQASLSNLSELQDGGSETDGDSLPGEKALEEIKERRRLQEIQQHLQRLSYGQDVTDEDLGLTEGQLQSLLEECELAETRSRDVDVDTDTDTDFSPR
uniref:Fibrous sheath-interacting protein 1 n=1 Tax=Knipowitschia caucasica TaxID=637954 RepID=A0AAV2JEP4_KNICA